MKTWLDENLWPWWKTWGSNFFETLLIFLLVPFLDSCLKRLFFHQRKVCNENTSSVIPLNLEAENVTSNQIDKKKFFLSLLMWKTIFPWSFFLLHNSFCEVFLGTKKLHSEVCWNLFPFFFSSSNFKRFVTFRSTFVQNFTAQRYLSCNPKLRNSF